MSQVADSLEEATYQISQRLQNVDTKPWIGKTLLLKVRSVNGNTISLEVIPPNETELAALNRSDSQKNTVADEDRPSHIQPKPSRPPVNQNPPPPVKDLMTQEITYGVEVVNEDSESQKHFAPIPLKTENYDFSLKVPTILEYIRKKQSIIFEGSRFSGKRRCIIGSLVSRLNPYIDIFKARILVLTFERESAEYFYNNVNEKISHMPNVRSCCCVGNTKLRDNIRDLQQGCQIVFGTPARLEDLLKRGVLKLDDISFVVMYCNRHLPAQFQDPLQFISRHLPTSFQYLITYPLGANFDFELLQCYTFNRFGQHVTVVDDTPHFHRLQISREPLYKRDVIWMIHQQKRIGLVCDRGDLRMVDAWLGDIPAPVKCLVPTYQKLPSKGRERRHYIKQSKTLFKRRVSQYEWGFLLILQESVKFAPTSLDGSLDIILICNSPRTHPRDYREHLLVKPGGHVFLNIPDLQFSELNTPTTTPTPVAASTSI